MASETPVEEVDSAPFEYIPPRIRWDTLTHAHTPAPAYYDWKDVYPFLAPLVEPTTRERIFRELCAATRVNKWFDWPETELYRPEEGESWRVLPFAHCFPAFDDTKLQWIEASVTACPYTAGLLRRIPGLRTALFSRLGPNMTLTPHQGWADLSNHVLRCHLPLYVPDEPEPYCGMVVDEEVKHHVTGDILIFDDSKVHSAFNKHPTKARYILIFDIMRPPGLPLGGATGSTTGELQALMDYFK